MLSQVHSCHRWTVTSFPVTAPRPLKSVTRTKRPKRLARSSKTLAGEISPERIGVQLMVSHRFRKEAREPARAPCQTVPNILKTSQSHREWTTGGRVALSLGRLFVKHLKGVRDLSFQLAQRVAWPNRSRSPVFRGARKSAPTMGVNASTSPCLEEKRGSRWKSTAS